MPPGRAMVWLMDQRRYAAVNAKQTQKQPKVLVFWGALGREQGPITAW